mmetsp:Transcript_74648/g.198596  ORF Transcript_74648/g.198596 Transcript_74648/m.198596 type:complete len:246 (+) Transcript_74648:677-1414(+)
MASVTTPISAGLQTASATWTTRLHSSSWCCLCWRRTRRTCCSSRVASTLRAPPAVPEARVAGLCGTRARAHPPTQSRCPSASCGAVRGLPPAAGSAAAGAAAVGAAAAGAAEVGAAAVGAAAAGAAAAGAAAGGAAAGAPGCESRVVGSAKALCAWQRAGHTHAARRTRRRARPPRLSRSECLPTGRRHGAGAVRCARVARPRSVDRVSFRFPRPRETLRHVPWAVRCPRVMGADRCLRTASHAG